LSIQESAAENGFVPSKSGVGSRPCLPNPRARAKSRLACFYSTVPAPEAAQRRMMGFPPTPQPPEFPGQLARIYSDPSHVPVIRVK
jgi:hypothetical protein